MEMNDLVSIVVPVYNMGDSINVCVDSILKQDYQNIEILLIDDGSKDDSYAKCLAMAEKDSRVVVYHTENRGSGPARNYGIEHASGRYVFFPDADDYMEPRAITTMLEAMRGGQYDLVVFGYTTVGQRGNVLLSKQYEEAACCGEAIREAYEEYVSEQKKYSIQGAPWNKFFDLELIRAHHIRYPSLRRHQDDGFIARYMCHAKHVHFIEDVLYVHYVNDLKKVWQKYPVDYIDAVIGLYETRKETILTWNPTDTVTHGIIVREYVCNVIKAMELTFSPKHGLKCSGRIAKMKEYTEKSGIDRIAPPAELGVYQRTILWMLRKRWYGIVYVAMFAKICVEKIMR